MVFCVRINCSESVKKQFGWECDEVKDTDFTETDLDNYDGWDIVIENDGNVDTMKRYAKEIASAVTLSWCEE